MQRDAKKYLAIECSVIFREPLQYADTTRADMVNGRKVMQEQGLPWTMWDDLVLVSQMQRLGISEIYSNDADFDKIRGIKRFF